jgi:hypothetical protein
MFVLFSGRNPDSCMTFANTKKNYSYFAVSSENITTKQLKIKCLAYLAQCNLYCFFLFSHKNLSMNAETLVRRMERRKTMTLNYNLLEQKTFPCRKQLFYYIT